MPPEAKMAKGGHESDDASVSAEPSSSPRRTPTSPLQGRPYAWIALFIVLVSLLIPQDDASSSMDQVHDVAAFSTGMERGKQLGSIITAQDLHQAYREIQEDYQQKAFGKTKGWKVLNDKNNVSVSMLHHPSDPNCPYVKMEALMPASPQQCWDFLALSNWDKTMPHMDPFYEGVSVYDSYHYRGVGMTLARKRTKRLLAFGKRDFFFVSVTDVPKRDGTLVSGTVSVIAPQLVPRAEGYTRAFQDSVAFYEPVGKDQTHLTIVCRIDLNDSNPDGAGGFMPMWLYVKTIGATGAQSVLSMRRYLESQLAEIQTAARTKIVPTSKKMWKFGALLSRRLQEEEETESVKEKTVHVQTRPRGLVAFLNRRHS